LHAFSTTRVPFTTDAALAAVLFAARQNVPLPGRVGVGTY
jgi:hypothetical protein